MLSGGDSKKDECAEPTGLEETEGEGAVGSRTAKLTTVSGEGLRFFVAEAFARQIPNPS